MGVTKELNRTADVDTALRDVYKEQNDLRRKYADMGGQIERLRTFVKADEKESYDVVMRGQKELIRTVRGFAEQVQALVNHSNDPVQMQQALAQAHYSMMRKQDNARVEDNLRKIKELTGLKQKSAPQCPCGSNAHKGIRFLQDEVEVAVLCPKNWWLKQSRLALSEKRLSAFVESLPLEQYLKAYSK